MGVLIPLILSAVGAHQKREQEAQRIPREKYLDQLEKSAAFGEKKVFDDPKTYKAAEKYGVEAVYNILNHIVQSDLSDAERASRVAALRGQRATGEATQAAGETETSRQRTIMQPAITGIAKGQAERQKAAPGTTGLPIESPAEMEIATTPTKMPSQAGQVQATVRGQEAQERVTTRGQDIDKMLGEKKIGLGYYEVNSRLSMAADDISQRTRDLEERQRTTMSAEDTKKLKMDEQKIEKDRIAVAAAAVRNDEQRTKLVDREQRMKLVEALIGEDVPAGKAARATRAITSFLEGKSDEIPKEVEEVVGVGTKKLTALRSVYQQAETMEKDAHKMIDDVIVARKSKNEKAKVTLTDEEVNSRLAEANDKLYKAVMYKYANRLIDEKEAAQELMANQRVLTDKQEILSPQIAAGLGRKFNTKYRGGEGRQQQGALAPNEQNIVDKFLKGTAAPEAAKALP